MPGLMPYINNGQMNNINLFHGESAQLQLTFFTGQDYRILVCNQDILGAGVYFEVKDEEGSLLYDSKSAEEKMWDFRVEVTSNLFIEVFVPGDEESHNELAHQGCIAVVVGFKE